MMEIKQEYDAYMKQIQGKPGLWEVNGETKEHLSLFYEEGKRISGGTDHQTVLYARAGETATGYAVSQCLSEDPAALLHQAAENGSVLENNGAAKGGVVPGNENVCSVEERKPLADVETLKQIVDRAEAELPGEKKMFAIKNTVHSQFVSNQKGLSRYYSRSHFELNAYVDGREYVATATAPELMQFQNMAADIAEMAKNDLPEIKIPSGNYRAILSNYVMNMFWITGWMLFSGRSYAGGAGAFAGRFLQQIASEKVNIQDVPALLGIGYEAPFDCEGTDGVAVDLIKDGVFSGLLHNLETAQKMGMDPTGNAGRTAGLVVGTDVTITPKNFLMCPGTVSDEEMLAKLGDGLYVFDAFDQFHAVNSASGQFSFPCSAVLVEGGVRKGVVRGLTMNGSMGDLLMEVEAVGDRLSYMPLLMHYTYQVAAPAILVKNLNVTVNI